MRVALRQGLELNYTMLLCSGDCTLRGVHYVIVRGGGGGCSIVKLLTPSTALCKYAYIFVHYHSHMHALQVQQLYRNKHIEAPNRIITIWR